MNGSDVGAVVGRIHIVDVSPTPTADEMVAIAAALEQAWPEPRAAMPSVTIDENRWRFASRPWLPPAVPLRRWSRT